jgi:hypothetical protein
MTSCGRKYVGRRGDEGILCKGCGTEWRKRGRKRDFVRKWDEVEEMREVKGISFGRWCESENIGL